MRGREPLPVGDRAIDAGRERRWRRVQAARVHGRLAVIRLAIAVDAGADVPPPFWNYCARVAAKAAELQELYVRAAKRAAHPMQEISNAA